MIKINKTYRINNDHKIDCKLNEENTNPNTLQIKYFE